MRGTYKIVRTKSRKYRVNYFGGNGEMLAQSEELNTKRAAIGNVNSMALIFVSMLTINGKNLTAVSHIKE